MLFPFPFVLKSPSGKSPRSSFAVVPRWRAIVIGFVITLPDSPDFTDNPSKYVPYYVDHKSDIILGGVALLLAGVLLLWFLGSILWFLALADRRALTGLVRHHHVEVVDLAQFVAHRLPPSRDGPAGTPDAGDIIRRSLPQSSAPMKSATRTPFARHGR